MSRAKHAMHSNRHIKSTMCLLIAAHNEELVLENTILSAIAAGMNKQHIYVVDDNSNDATSKVARAIVPKKNVFKVRRSGKGLAITKANKKFNLSAHYRWIHIADADGAFANNYFKELRKNIRVKYVAATGYIKSLPAKRVSEYRVYEYTVGMELHRRLQDLFGVIPIIPGPTSCFRADVFEQLDFSSKTLTEDFDVTMQIHRLRIGKIQFIPTAIAYTQDPLTMKNYVNQISRWNRGVLQGMIKHSVGKKARSIDAYLLYQLLQSLLMAAFILVWVPYASLTRGGLEFLSTVFVLDVFITFVITLLSGLKSKRFDIISAFPTVYCYKWLSLFVFVKSFMEVVILGRYRTSEGTWDNGSVRRYKTNIA